MKIIGVTDSGVGGLTTLREMLPYGGEFYYYMDNAHMPYGNKSKDKLMRRAEEIMRAFEGIDAQAVVLACNTLTSQCAEELRKLYSIPIIGIEPAVKPALKECNRALVLATPRTVVGHKLDGLIEGLECGDRVVKVGCHGLADLVERDVEAAYEYVDRIISEHPDCGAVVLGCTHYVFLKEHIESAFGIKAYDGNKGVAAAVCAKFGRDDDARVFVRTTAECDRDFISRYLGIETSDW